MVLLTRAKDPVLAALEAAPFDEEPETEEERNAVAEPTPTVSGASNPYRLRACAPSSTATSERAVPARRR